MKQDWPHAPVHRFAEAGVYFITGSTLRKRHVYRDPAAMDALQSLLFEQVLAHACLLQAWALFSNHYHLVVESDAGESVRNAVARFHTEAAKQANLRDDKPGRQVWYQCRDTKLTFEGSWLARLRYTHENAVHHRLVSRAPEYQWCSAKWFEENASSAFVKTVAAVKIDRVQIYDDY